MTQQTEAQRLADELDSESTTGRISNHAGRKAADELRRLSRWEEIFSEWDSPADVHEALVDQAKDINALKAVKAQLLEALEDLMDTGYTGGPQRKRARAAIAAAKEQP